MESTVEKKHTLYVIILALLIHLCCITPLLIYKWAEQPIDLGLFSHTATDDVPIIFQNPTSAQLPQQQDDNQWAAMKAGASSFGMPDAPDVAEDQLIKLDQVTPEMVPDVPDTLPEPQAPQPQPENTQEEQASAQKVAQESSTRLLTSDQGPSLKLTPTNIAPTSTSKTTNPSPTKAQREAAKKLAHFTRGYLDQLHSDGNNLVNLIGGDPNKRPTAEQLKHERYWAKLQWCIQNSWNINRDSYRPQKPVRTMLQVFFTVAKDGKMGDLKITKSSGYADLDNFMMQAFRYASSSFPPLPAFITQDPYPIMYTIEVFPGDESGWYAYRE